MHVVRCTHMVKVTKCPAKTKRKAAVCNFRVSFSVGVFSRLGLWLGRHFVTFTCPYFTPEVMVKNARRATGHFLTLIETRACI